MDLDDDDWLLIRPEELAEPRPEDALTILRLHDEITRAALKRPAEFASLVVHALKDELNLVAATMYINCPELHAYKLKAAAGFDYEAYKSFLLPNPSYPSVAGDHIDQPILIAMSPFQSRLYRDRSLLARYNIQSLVVVPFRPPDEVGSAYPNPLGAICLYPPDNGDFQRIATISESLVQLIGTLYVAALERLLMDLRTRAVQSAAFDNSLSDVCRRLLSLTQEQLKFDAGSVWLLNPRRELMYLRSALPGIRNDGKRVMEHVVHLDHITNPLVRSLLDSEVVYHAGAESFRSKSRKYAQFDSSKVLEEITEPLRNGILFPLTPAQQVTLGNAKRDSIGLIVVLNKFTDLDGVRDYLPMTWEDEKLLQFMAEIAAVLVFQDLRGTDHEADYERRIHGLKTNLTSVRTHLEALEDRESISRLVSRNHQYYIPNCIEWLREMEQQVSRTDRISRLQVAPKETLLYARILTKAFQGARSAARAAEINPFTIDADELIATAHGIPPVMADTRAMLTVFRNLFENTLKYRDKSRSELLVHIWHSVDLRRHRLTLHYQDNGMGVLLAETDRIFEYGYRSRIARRVHVQGEGIGLSECRALLSGMRASIKCSPPLDRFGSGAHFEIDLSTNTKEDLKKRQKEKDS